jgi:hypothetical protein
MINFQERYLVDAQGQRLGVFLDMADYQKILAALTKLESLDEPADVSEPRHSVKELLDLALADRHPTTFTVEQQLFVAVVLRDQVELIEQMQRALRDCGVASPLPEECVACYDDLEVAARNTVTKEVSTQPTLLDVLDQVISQKEVKWVNYQNQLLLVVGPLEEEALLEALEDCIDNANADAALREGGETIPWEQVVKELGL